MMWAPLPLFGFRDVDAVEGLLRVLGWHGKPPQLLMF
jgi:hypothetical protein